MPGVSVMELSLGAWCECHGAITGCLVGVSWSCHWVPDVSVMELSLSCH